MYDTHVTVVGNVLHEPEWRRTANTGALLATFKIASTARRLNRETGQWVDGNSLRVRVTCWRALASNVRHSVTRGDPVIVTGRLFTRDWRDKEGVLRTQYELEAAAVGHDLSRGRAVFERVRANTATSAVEDAQAQERVGGEPTELVPDEEAPSQFNDVPYEVAARAAEYGLENPLEGGSAGVPAGREARPGTAGAPASVGSDSVGPDAVRSDLMPADSLGRALTDTDPLDSDPLEDPVDSDQLDAEPVDHEPLDPAVAEALPGGAESSRPADGRGRRRQGRAKVPA